MAKKQSQSYEIILFPESLKF